MLQLAVLFKRSRQYFLYISLLIGLTLIFTTFVNNVVAQNTSFSFTTRVAISGESILDGYIVATSDEGFIVTTEAYQKNIVGVVTENPGIELNTGEAEGTFPLATNGEASVWVSLANGEINKGDSITSSPWEGVGMKATGSGPILGTALEDVTIDEEENNEQIITKIRVSILPSDTNPNSSASTSSSSSNKAGPFTTASLIRFGTGAIILLVTILLSLGYFGKLSRTGVEALGRNPLAFKKIEFGITINIVIGFLVALVGIAAALYIMR